MKRVERPHTKKMVRKSGDDFCVLELDAEKAMLHTLVSILDASFYYEAGVD